MGLRPLHFCFLERHALQAIVIRAGLFSFDFDGILFMRKIKIVLGMWCSGERQIPSPESSAERLVAAAATGAKYVHGRVKYQPS